MSTYIELVNRAEAAASAAEQSALNTANNKTIVQGLLTRMQGVVANTATLPIPSIQVNPSTGIVTAEYTATAGNVLSSTQRIGTLDISSLLDSGQGTITEFYKCASVSGPYTETYYAVSGAGMQAVNGNYTDTGTTSGGKPVYSYTNSGTTYYLFYDSGWETWFIHTSTSFSDYAMDECLYYKSDWEESWYTGGGGSGGSPSVTLTTVTHDLPKTWTGYKAVFDAVTGTYSFESTATTGLTWTTVKPQVGKIYSGDLKVIVSSLDTGMPDDPVFYAPLDEYSASAETGQSLTVTGSPVFSSSYQGIPCVQFSGSDVIEAANTDIPYSENPYSVSLWVNIASNPSNEEGILSIGYEDSGALMAIMARSSGVSLSGHNPGYGWDNVSPAQVTFDGTWKHLALVFGQGSNGNRMTYLYIDGVLAQSGIFVYEDWAYSEYTPRFFLGSYWETSLMLTGHLAAVRVYNYALSVAEIATLAAEFTPTAA